VLDRAVITGARLDGAKTESVSMNGVRDDEADTGAP